MENDKWTFRTFMIPERMRGGLTRYVENGIAPGGFLTAVFENNFMEAVGRADDENLQNLPAYANYIYNHVPHWCHGSPTAVSDWIARGGSQGNSGRVE